MQRFEFAFPYVIVAVALLVLIGLQVVPTAGAKVSGAHGSTATPVRGTGQVTTLDMTSASTGWAWGPEIFVHTSDAAARLIDVTPAGVDDRQILAETAIDATHAWIVVGPPSGIGRFAVYRTVDGGAAWSAFPVSRDQAGDVTFVDARHGWMQASRLVDDHRVDEITLSRTSDGGASWTTIRRTRQRIDIQPNVQTGDCERSLPRFATPLRGIIGLSCEQTATPRIERTDDGGRTWRRIALPPLRRPAGIVMWNRVQPLFFSRRIDVAFVTVCVGDGRSCANLSALYRSNDGGTTWTASRIVVRGGAEAIAADPAHVWLTDACLRICRSSPLLLRTQDGGAHWTALSLPRTLDPNMDGFRQFDFVSASVGFVVAGREFDPRTHFYRTDDGGQTFHSFQPRIIRP